MAEKKVAAKAAKPAAAKAAPKPKASPKAKVEAAPAAEKATPVRATSPKGPKPAPAAAKAPRVKKPKTGSSTAPERKSARKVRSGLVVSNKMEKTVVVLIQRRTQHPIYGKVVIRSNKFKAHDIVGCDVGDLVEIMETRPMSKDKRWRVTQILEKVK